MPRGDTGGGLHGFSPSRPDKSGRLSALLKSLAPSSPSTDWWSLALTGRGLVRSPLSLSSLFVGNPPLAKFGENGGSLVGVFELELGASLSSSLGVFTLFINPADMPLGIPGIAGGISDFLGRPLFFFPVTGSIGLFPLGNGLPNSSTLRLLGAGKDPSGLGLGGRPLLFFPVSGSILGSCPSII